MSKVYVVKGPDAYKNTQRILTMAGRDFINNIKSPLLIKPNLVYDQRNTAATTDPSVVKAILDFIGRYVKVDQILIADGSSGDTLKAFEVLGYRAMFEDLDIELRDLNRDKTIWIDAVDPLTDRPKKIPIAQSVLNARYIISCARPKTHDHAKVTLGLKNLIGIVPGKKWKLAIHGGKYPDELTDTQLERSVRGFHRNILALNKKVRIDFSIIDGTVGMEGNGPIGGTPKRSNFGLGGTDPVAVDAIGTFLMGFDPYEVGYIHLCEKARLGIADLSLITVESTVDWMKLRKRYKPHWRYSHMQYRPYAPKSVRD